MWCIFSNKETKYVLCCSLCKQAAFTTCKFAEHFCEIQSFFVSGKCYQNIYHIWATDTHPIRCLCKSSYTGYSIHQRHTSQHNWSWRFCWKQFKNNLHTIQRVVSHSLLWTHCTFFGKIWDKVGQDWWPSHDRYDVCVFSRALLLQGWWGYIPHT